MTHDPPYPLRIDEPWSVTQVPPPIPFSLDPDDLLCSPAGPVHLQDVVDTPGWSLAVEYKSWRNLRNPDDQAEIARDIAAIANSGGGAIAFGFDEGTLAPADTDPFRTDCDAATISAIVSTFLDPPPRCEMALLRSATGEQHPAIRVPPHGATPVFTRAESLPSGGRRVLERGAIYIRRHGPPRRGALVPRPESVPLSCAADWAPLLRRCLRAERETLLGAIEAVLEGRRDVPGPTERLRAFHTAAHAAFLALVPRGTGPESIGTSHHVLSYALELDRSEILEPVQMPELLARAVLTVQDQIRVGPRLFDPPYRRAARPRFIADALSGDEETDIIETAWLRDTSQKERADLWRVSPRGLATIVRPYAEDEPALNTALNLKPGTWLSPNALARDLAELVFHARALARLFDSVRAVSFRCEWQGLQGRRIFDPSARWAQSDIAVVDRRVVTLRAPFAMLGQAWPAVVAQMMAPLLRTMEPDLALGPDWVREQAPRWR